MTEMAALSSSVDSGGAHISSELKVILLGGRNSGKSSAGNTILGRDVFDTQRAVRKCMKGHRPVHGWPVTVVDTPGWVYYNFKAVPQWLKYETINSIKLCQPGPHAFLLVVPLFFPLVRKAIHEYMMIFGETIWTQTILLFTWGDLLGDTTIEQHLETEGQALQWLLDKCENRYHVFNNKDKENHSQVTDLLKEISHRAYGITYRATDLHLQMDEGVKEEEHGAKTKIQQSKPTRGPEAEDASILRLENRKELEEILYRFKTLESSLCKLTQKHAKRQRKVQQRTKELYKEGETEMRSDIKEGLRGRSLEGELKREKEKSAHPVRTRLLPRLSGSEGGAVLEREHHSPINQSRKESQTGVGEDQGQSRMEELKTDEPALPVRRRNSSSLMWRPNVNAETPSPVSPASPPASELRLVLLGHTGAGKSAAGNTILGREEFVSQASSSPVSTKSDKRRADVAGRQVAVVDTPDWFYRGFSQGQMRRDVGVCFNLSSPGPHAFLLVIPVGRYTGEERNMLDRVLRVFGEGAVGHTMVLFTHGDELRDRSIEEFVQTGSEDLRWLVEKCGNRYHVLNSMGDVTQVTQLLEKVEEMVEGHSGSHYCSETYMLVESKIIQLQQQLLRERQEGWKKEEERVKEKNKIEIQDDLSRIEREMKQLQENIVELEERIPEMEKQLKEERNKEKWREKQQQLKGQREELDTQKREMEGLMEEQEREIREMEERNAEETEKIKQKYEEEAREDAERHREALQQLSELTAQEHRAALTLRDEERDRLETEIERLRESCAEKAREIQGLRERVGEMERETERQEELKNMKQELEEQDKESEEESLSIKQLWSMFDYLKATMEKKINSDD